MYSEIQAMVNLDIQMDINLQLSTTRNNLLQIKTVVFQLPKVQSIVLRKQILLLKQIYQHHQEWERGKNILKTLM